MTKQPVQKGPQAIEPDLEGVAIDRDAEVPIGLQLAWALRTRMRDGDFKPGQRLPGLRDLAREVGVNLNTVRAVYQRLEHEGLIESRQGSGTFVASTSSRASAVGRIVADAAREARDSGVDPREVAAALYVTSELLFERADEAGVLSELDQRRLLRRQITAFERALGEIEAAHPGVAPASSATPRGRGPALLSAQELEQVRTLLVRRLVAVQAAIDAPLAESDPVVAPVPKRARSKHRTATSPKRAPGPRGTTRPAGAET